MKKFYFPYPILLLLLFGCGENNYLGYASLQKRSLQGGSYGDSGPYKLFSSNEEFYMISIPYEHVNVILGDLCSGSTRVFKSSNDSMHYSIDRYFALDNTYLNADGSSIAYVNNYWKGSSYDSCSTNTVEFFKHGKLKKGYTYEDFSSDSIIEQQWNWLYQDSDSNEWLAKNNQYLIDSMLYLITNQPTQVIIANINSCQIVEQIDTSVFLQNLSLVPQKMDSVEFINIEEIEGLPKLNKGTNFETTASKRLNVEILSDDNKTSQTKHYYRFYIDAVVDSTGTVLNTKIKTNSHVLKEESSRIRHLLQEFIKESVFQRNSNPYNLEKWKYTTKFNIARKPNSLAEKDKERYEIELCKLDSFNLNYIPEDLSDSHRELDKQLSESDKLGIANGEESHFGLGKQLRNKWALWAGGRLSCYFRKKGINHPDHMSGLILETYNMKLNNLPINEDSIIIETIESIKEWNNQ